MPEKYTWDAQAAQGIKDHDLDKHFQKNLYEYLKIVKPIWTILCNNNQQPSYLKHDDFFATLVPIFERTSMLQAAFDKEGLPQTGERGNYKWLCWFTHYVAEQCLITSKTGKVGQDKELAKLKFKNKDKIKDDVDSEIKSKKKTKKKLLKKAKNKRKVKASKN